MDNEVTELYKNAGVEKINNCKGCEYEKEYICPDDCPQQQLEYPPFTAEKQIELTQKIWELRPNIYPNFDLLVDHSYGEMIATFVNNRWKEGLTEQEKEQIRNILKG